MTSRSKHKTYIGVLSLFYLTFFFSFGIFVAKPRWFYWRAWEYFREISYNIPHKCRWKGYETGDIERTAGKKAVLKHFEWATVASCDENGARSVPYRKNFLIAFGGDSQTWGSGLSDPQTIPWQVAKRLCVPVYNGASSPFKIENGLKHPQLEGVKIIVESPVREYVISRSIQKDVVLSDRPFKDYMLEDLLEDLYETPPYPQKTLLNYTRIHPKRFFLPAKLMRGFSLTSYAKKLLLPLTVSPPADSIRPPEIRDEEGVRHLANLIQQRARSFNQLGYEYVFSMIPGKQMMLHPSEEEIRLSQLFSSMLVEGGVHYVDIMEVFNNHPLRNQLYLPTDTHINEYGAELVSEKISEYLERHFHGILEESKNLKST